MKHYFNLCAGKPMPHTSGTGTYTVEDGRSWWLSSDYKAVACDPPGLRAFGAWLIAVADGAVPVPSPTYDLGDDVWLP